MLDAGVFVASEEEGSNEVNLNEEEFDAADLSTLDGWNHHTLALNVLGRVKPNPPKLNPEGEEVCLCIHLSPFSRACAGVHVRATHVMAGFLLFAGRSVSVA